MNKDEFIMSRVKRHYDFIESLGYDIVYIAAQGSMNYNLFIMDDEYKSDVDTKIIVVPTLDNLIKGTSMISKKYDFEGEQIDVKDIRLIMDIWKKQNQSYLEILFSNYNLINSKYLHHFQGIKDMAGDIVKMNIPQLARCIRGMASEKVKALEHPYPATQSKITDHGFDEKQIASTARLAILMGRMFIKGMSFNDSIYFEDNTEERDYLINIKKCKDKEGNLLTLEEARGIMNIFDSICHNIKKGVIDEYGDDDFQKDIYDRLKDRVYELVKYGITKNINE